MMKRGVFVLLILVVVVLGVWGVSAGTISHQFLRSCSPCNGPIGTTPTVKYTVSCGGTDNTDACVNNYLYDYMCGGGYIDVWWDLYLCDGSTPYCYDGRCVECTGSAHCGTDKSCISNQCVCPVSDLGGIAPACTAANAGSKFCASSTSLYICEYATNCYQWRYFYNCASHPTNTICSNTPTPECYAPACTDTCTSLGYECGVHTICGESTNCGGCVNGKSCSSGSCVCDNECTLNQRDCETNTQYKICKDIAPADGCPEWSYVICGNGQTCIGGYCCMPESYSGCPYGQSGDAYWYDSCGNLGNVHYFCGANEICSGGNCVCSPTTTCAAEGKICGIIWDGCNNVNCGNCYNFCSTNDLYASDCNGAQTGCTTGAKIGECGIFGCDGDGNPLTNDGEACNPDPCDSAFPGYQECFDYCSDLDTVNHSICDSSSGSAVCKDNGYVDVLGNCAPDYCIGAKDPLSAESNAYCGECDRQCGDRQCGPPPGECGPDCGDGCDWDVERCLGGYCFPKASNNCGNGRLDPGELCDPGSDPGIEDDVFPSSFVNQDCSDINSGWTGDLICVDEKMMKLKNNIAKGFFVFVVVIGGSSGEDLYKYLCKFREVK